MSLFELVLGGTPLVNAVLCGLTCLGFCVAAILAWFVVVDPDRQEKRTARRQRLGAGTIDIRVKRP